eukprot:gene25888-11561_t
MLGPEPRSEPKSGLRSVVCRSSTTSDVFDDWYVPGTPLERFIGDVTVEQIEDRGRGVVATETIQPGELLMLVKPIAWKTALAGVDLGATELTNHILTQKKEVLQSRWIKELLYDGTAASLRQTPDLSKGEKESDEASPASTTSPMAAGLQDNVPELQLSKREMDFAAAQKAAAEKAAADPQDNVPELQLSKREMAFAAAQKAAAEKAAAAPQDSVPKPQLTNWEMAFAAVEKDAAGPQDSVPKPQRTKREMALAAAQKAAVAKPNGLKARVRGPAPGTVAAQKLLSQRIRKLVSFNSYGEDEDDLAAAHLREEDAVAHVGLWGEFAMLNHR